MTRYYDKVVRLKCNSDGWWVCQFSAYPSIWKLVSDSGLQNINPECVKKFILEEEDIDNIYDYDGSTLLLKYDKGEWFAKGPNEQDCSWKPVCDCNDGGRIDTDSVCDLMEDIYTTM